MRRCYYRNAAMASDRHKSAASRLPPNAGRFCHDLRRDEGNAGARLHLATPSPRLHTVKAGTFLMPFATAAIRAPLPVKLDAVGRLLDRAGVLAAAHRAWPNRLTVLAYHRIGDPIASGNSLPANISATPAAFAEQMEFLRRQFDVISLADLVRWRAGQAKLPRFPALITFDDGYRDNLEAALPILRARGLPAVLFVATDCIEGKPFYWDLAACCFHRTSLTHAELPIIGRAEWPSGSNRAILRRWIEAAKRLPDGERRAAVAALPEALGVAIPGDAFAGLYLDWDELRALQRGGVDLGAHTRSHAILTRIGPIDAAGEIRGSKTLLESRTGAAVTAFAYPNGGPDDFDRGHRKLLASLGIELAFTLISGPQGIATARRDPLAIRRIFIGHRDDPWRFAAKVCGLTRVFDWLR
jgi:peptidoglycan/xylan/chitin deacetylase (PgdA/CDA1 family)